jgi:hypothetical protein
LNGRFPPVLPLRVVCETGNAQRLPPFLGSALHGVLGRSLYRTVCAFPRRGSCPGCPIYARCAYPALFQSPVPARETLAAAGIRDQAPRPLVLAPEAGWTRPSGHAVRLAAGAAVPFRVTLIGRAADDLAVVVVALREAARRGIGLLDGPVPASGERPPRAPLSLLRIETEGEAPQVVYDGATDRFSPPRVPAIAGDEERNGGTAEIDFSTPIRLKQGGRLVSAIVPPSFVLALARRANALGILYGAGEAVVDEKLLVEAAETLAVELAELRLVHVRRYSTPQRARMVWPGLMGKLRWRGGRLDELWPLLRFGELVQVGKGTALGFGRYRLAVTGGS